jgi:hypothetical protein
MQKTVIAEAIDRIHNEAAGAHDDDDDGRLFRVILRAGIAAGNQESALLETISVAKIESLDDRLWDFEDVAPYVEGLMNRIERPKPVSPGDDTVFVQLP